MKIQQLFLIKLAIFLSLIFCYSCFAASKITTEEYKIYSAYINQACLEANLEWFTIEGVKVGTLADIDKVEQVVISPVTLQNIHNSETLAEGIKQLPKNLFAGYLRQNLKSYKLANKFKTGFENFLLPVDKQGWNLIEIEARKQNVPYEKLFFEKYPKSVGAFYFSRIGFDPAHKNALLAVSAFDTFNRRRAGFSPFPKWLILSKQNGQWKIKKVIPENENIKSIDLQKCKPDTKFTYLGEGSTYLQIKGIEYGKGVGSGKCHIIDELEIEQGYTKVECFIPTTLREVLLTLGEPNTYSKNLSGYCLKPKTGNGVFDYLNNKKNN